MTKVVKTIALLAILVPCLLASQSTGGGLQIVNASLPSGTVGAAYKVPLSATGGTAPYTWFAVGIAPGKDLPPGLAIVQAKPGTTAGAKIAGTPTAAGVYPFELVVDDSAHHVARKSFSISVQAQVAQLNLSASPSALTINQGSQGVSTLTSTVSGGFNAAVSFSASGLPAGTTVVFNPQILPPPGSGQSVATFTVSASTAAGTYPVTITGNGGTLQALTVITLTVQEEQSGEPEPTPPQAFVDTTFNLPSGHVWPVHTAAQLTSAIASSAPGDIIQLDCGVVYSTANSWTLPAKANPNNLWIYVMTNCYSQLPPPGTRVGPSNAPQMAVVTTSTVYSVFTPAPGANHWRFVGLEMRSDSTQGGNPSNNPPSNNFTWNLFGYSETIGQALPDSFTFDRMYVHGSDTQDVGQGIQCNASNCAVIDSYIDDIHEATFDSQAVLVYFTPGPIKITNNYLGATTENLMFGGAGNYNNPYVPSDIVIDGNTLEKKLAWDSCGVHGTVPQGFILPNGQQCPGPEQWAAKTVLELKSAQRVQITNNKLMNDWPSAQTGFAVDLTVRTSQSGNVAVVDDVDMENNQITGTTSGVFIIGQDGQCSAQQGYPDCTTPGEEKRVKVANNQIELRHGQDSTRNQWLNLDGGNTYRGVTTIGSTDDIIEHNSAYMNDGSEMGWGWFVFAMPQLSWGCTPPPGFSSTHNVWILDNAVVSQPSGDCGYQGQQVLTYNVSDPSPVAPRFVGNVWGVPSDEQVQNWLPLAPCNESVQGAMQFNSQGQLTNFPYGQCTTDGQPAGYNPGQ